MNQQINKQKGFYTSDLTSTVLWTISTVVSVILAFLFAITLMDIITEKKVSSDLESASLEILTKVQENFQNTNDQVNTSVNKNLAIYGNDYSQLVSAIKKDLSNNLRVMVSTQPLRDITPQEFPGINYATLDMLKNTKSENKNPIAEIHLFGQQDQYLNYIFIIDSQNDHFLIVSLPANEVMKNLGNPKIEQGYIRLVQAAGQFSLVNLKSWGKQKTGENLYSRTKNIPNSFFSIKYEHITPFYFLRGMTVLSALVGLLSSILLCCALMISLIRKIKIQKQKKLEQVVYVPQGPVNKDKTIDETIKKHNEKENMTQQENNVEKQINLDKTIFRAYDIRGIVNESLTTQAVELIGQAIGTENINRGKTDIVVARDGRLSGPTLLTSLINGLKKSGCNVINIGAVPTGVLYFATHHLETGSGVMLTGSHNPSNYNGLKIMLNGETLSGKLIMDLYKSIKDNQLVTGDGSEQEMDIVDDYIDYISSDIQLENTLKVVVDSGNGIGGEVGPQLLEEIGCEVIPLHCEIDGNFPNHHPDPSVPENLKDLIAAVKATDADLGIAFDGDADRLGVVTKNGDNIFSDRVLMLFAEDVLTREPGASIIFDVKCTGHLPKEIVKNGGLPIIWKTGHSFMKAKLKETNAALAGEMSGHFFFNERWFGFDDGIYAAARLLEILDNKDMPAQEVFDQLPNSISTPELKCYTEEGENYAFMEKFQKTAEFPDANLTTIDGIRADFSDGWGLVRCSNTTPCLVMRFDANDAEALEKIKEEFRTQILAVDETLDLPF